MEQTQCSETSACKIQTPDNYPEESIQHSEKGENLKSYFSLRSILWEKHSILYIWRQIVTHPVPNFISRRIIVRNSPAVVCPKEFVLCLSFPLNCWMGETFWKQQPVTNGRLAIKHWVWTDKANNPCTSLDRPWGFQKVELPKFPDHCHMKVVRWSAQGTGQLYPAGNIRGMWYAVA
jgi:hypothetical protein